MGLFVYSNNWLQVDVSKRNSLLFQLNVYFSLFSRFGCFVYLELFSCQFDERRTFKHHHLIPCAVRMCVCGV